jgi:predicted membrane protein
MEKEQHLVLTIIYLLMIPVFPGYSLYEMVEFNIPSSHTESLARFISGTEKHRFVFTVDPYPVLLVLIEVQLAICVLLRLVIFVLIIVYQVMARGGQKSQIWKKKNRKKEKKEKAEVDDVKNEELQSEFEEVEETEA